MSDLRTQSPASEESTLLVDVSPSDVAVAEPAVGRDSVDPISVAGMIGLPSPESSEIHPLSAVIHEEVRVATRGGVRDLEVRVTSEDIRLRGRCSTYYCKQLAQQAAKNFTGGARLYNEIEVW
jgi:hypothetical protein